MSCMTLTDDQKLLASAEYISHFGGMMARKTNPIPEALSSSGLLDEGRVAVMGWDFMITTDDHPYLIEINAICNLIHSENSARDTFNKTNLAQAFFDVVLNPIFGGAEVKESEFLHRVI